jgi:hypothetical protein
MRSLFLAFFTVTAVTAAAQTPRDARAIVTIVDMTGAILPGATVTITPRDRPAQAMVVTATDDGIATVSGLKPGRYAIKAEFPGFDAIELEDVRLRAGDNKQHVELELTGFTDTVEVGQDPQAAASNPNNTLATELSADEIENLSDDPNEMMRQLVEMTGGAARVRIDGFNGGSLPSRDVSPLGAHWSATPFPAENHSAENDGHRTVDHAGPGIGARVRGGFSTRVRDSVFSGDNPFVDVKAPDGRRSFERQSSAARSNRTRARSRCSSAGAKAFDSGRLRPTGHPRGQDIDAARAGGEMMDECKRMCRLQPEQEVMCCESATRENYVDAQQSAASADSILPRRAYSSETSGNQLRMQETGPIGTNMFLNTRLQLRLFRSESTAELEAQTIRVLDGVTRGGAQVDGGVNQKDIELATDLNYIRGIHTMRAGLELEGRHYRTDSASNYLGTFIFPNGESFLNGRPRNFTQRIGDPLIVYSHLEGGAYVQDDLRLRPNLTFSPGLRYELQDARSRSHRLRTASWPDLGAGQEWRHDDSHQLRHFLQLARHQRLRADVARRRRPPAGNQHREPVVSQSCGDATISASNKYVLGDIQMERIHRFSAAIESRHLTEAARQPRLRDGAVSQPAARGESQRAGCAACVPIRHSPTSSR